MTPDPSDYLRFELLDGSVPPPYHSDTTYTLGADGTGVCRVERSYGRGETTETPLALAPEALAALWADLRALGLFSTAWTADPRPPVGGSSRVLVARHGGETVAVPRFVVAEQAAAKRALVDRVREALAEARS